MATPKEYGLIKRGSKKNSIVIQPRPSIFDEDEEDSSEDGRKGVGKSLQKEADRINAKKQTKLNLQSALAEDPTVFEYDTVYDDMVKKKAEEIGVKKATKVKKSRYIESLLKAAQSRKLDQERATERKVQKERLAEGQLFADKEAFVTSAYKKKMQELQEQEEKEKRQAEIDALTDVTKQADLSGFYRQIYRQTLGSKTDPASSDKTEATTSIKKETVVSDSEEASTATATTAEAEQRPSSIARQPRQFRKHIRDETSSSSSSSSSSDEDEKSVERRPQKDNEKQKETENSSMSGEESVDGGQPPKAQGKVKASNSKAIGSQRPRKVAKRKTTSDEDSVSESSSGEEDRGASRKKRGDKVEAKKLSKEELMVIAREKRRALFTKRNVGDVFEAARRRFLERRDARKAAMVH